MKNFAVTKRNIGVAVLSFLAVAAMFVVQVIAVIVAMIFFPNAQENYLVIGFAELASALVGIGIFAAMGGGSWYAQPPAVMLDTAKFASWSLLLSTGLGIYAFIEYLMEGAAVSQTWLADGLGVGVLCLAIGYYEEIVFRGFVFNALLALFGSTKKGVWFSIILSCLVFGVAHIEPSTDFNTPLLAFQAIGKILQTGSWAFLLCVCVLKNHEMHAPSLIHAYEDFAIGISSAVFSDSFFAEYVQDEPSEGVIAGLFYLVVVALYLPFIIKSFRWMKEEGRPDLGALSKVQLLDAPATAGTIEGVVQVSEVPAPEAREVVTVVASRAEDAGAPPPPTGWKRG